METYLPSIFYYSKIMENELWKPQNSPDCFINLIGEFSTQTTLSILLIIYTVIKFSLSIGMKRELHFRRS